MDFLFEPGSPLFDFLKPFELLKMLHLTRAARRAAIPKLKAFQAAAPTAAHALMFEDWLEKPLVTGSTQHFSDMKRSKCGNKLAGPLRLGSIEQLYDRLRESFVVLHYEKTYTRESSCIGIFDNDGAFVAYYELVSKQHYEPFVRRNVDVCAHGGAVITVLSSASFHLGDRSDARWAIEDQGLEWEWRGGLFGEITFSNHALFNLFHGILSPTEVAMVLMHALSSDTRVIYEYTETVFYGMESDFEPFEDDISWVIRDDDEDPEATLAAIKSWERSLPGV